MAKFAVIFCIILVLVIQYTFANRSNNDSDEEEITVDSIMEKLKNIFESETYKNAKSDGIKLGEEIETMFLEITNKANEA